MHTFGFFRYVGHDRRWVEITRAGWQCAAAFDFGSLGNSVRHEGSDLVAGVCIDQGTNVDGWIGAVAYFQGRHRGGEFGSKDLCYIFMYIDTVGGRAGLA